MISLLRTRTFWMVSLAVCSLSSLFYAQNQAPRQQQSTAPVPLAVLERQYQESENTLRLVYDDLTRLINAFPAPEFKAQLDESQQSWAKYRGQQAKLLADAAEAAEGDWTATLLEEVTRQNTNRIAELRVVFFIMEHNFRKRFPDRTFSAPSTKVEF